MFDKKNVEDIRILNNAQNSILIAGLKEQKIDAYIHHLCFDISGELDIDLMKKAYAHLLAKYSVLRSVILYKNLQKPVQVIMKTREDGLACIKITDEELEQETDKVIRKEKERLGKIEGTYMYHMFLLQRDQFHGRLILSFHHIILDGWSLGLVVVEFFQMYHRLKEGIKISEKEEFVLKDYLQWKKKNQMEEITPVLRDMMNLPVKPTGIEPQWTREDGFEEKACTHLLNKEFYSEIEIFCRKNNITSNAFFLGIWSILLANYNQTDEVSFGTVLSGRNVKVPSIEEAVGLFIQTVPIILKIDRKAYPLELMKIINEISLLYMKDPNSVDYCQEKGMQSYNHIVAFENYPIADLLVSKNDTFGVEISNIQYYGYTSFDFGFSLTPIHDETVEISIKYNAYCYTEAFMEQIIAGYNRLIEQALQVNVQIEDISLVDKETEKAVYLGNLDWNNKGTILERFEKILSENKNHMALVDSNKTIT